MPGANFFHGRSLAGTTVWRNPETPKLKLGWWENNQSVKFFKLNKSKLVMLRGSQREYLNEN